MPHITRESLLSLEAYARERDAFRNRVIEHKKSRKLALGENVTLLFEDELTIRYQVQEMLRVERTFEEDGIVSELDAYNPLIPDGGNLKATMLIEYSDPEERKVWLSHLKGIESRVWLEVEDYPRVYAIADEDLDRENEQKTSAVHFLRFELTPRMQAAMKRGASLAAGIDHPQYQASLAEVDAATRASLAADLA